MWIGTKTGTHFKNSLP